MIILIVQGLPKNLGIGQFSVFLKKTILKRKRAQFLATQLEDTNELKIQFKMEMDAELAFKTLQNYNYKYKDRKIYVLNSYILEANSNKEFEYEESSILKEENVTNACDSYKESMKELSEVDNAIELVKKKRLLLEEERKLLLEKKKMELVQLTVPSDLNELMTIKKVCANGTLNTIEDMIAKKKATKKMNRSPAVITFKLCQRLFGQMARFYYAVKPEGCYELRRKINTVLKARVKEIIRGNEHLSNMEIISIYRKAYPEAKDEAFIKGLALAVEKERLKEANGKEERSISELSELQEDVDMNDLDDWTGGDDEENENTVIPMTKDEPKEQESEETPEVTSEEPAPVTEVKPGELVPC